MRTRAVASALLITLVLPACARNKTSEDVGAARDSTAAIRSDSTRNQTESGVTDSTGQSTLGKGVERTRPDQGQPVTSKGDTINKGVDSSSTQKGADSSSTQR